MLTHLLSLFRCTHERTSWPQLDRSTGINYVRCTDCGTAIQYDLETMSRIPHPQATAPIRSMDRRKFVVSA